MKRSLLAVATVGAVVAVLAACQSQNSPTAASQSEAVQAVDAQNGQVSATDTVPGGPGSSPTVPGGPGSSPVVPGGPGSGPLPGAPGGGGGGGGASPTPTPGTTPTPGVTPTPTATPTPAPVACTGRHTYESTDTPVTFPSDEFGTVSTIDVPDFVDDCAVADLKISVYITSDIDLSNYSYAGIYVNYTRSGNHWLFPFSDDDTTPPDLSGTSLGSGCANLSFQEGSGVDFATATPPFVGVFEPELPWDFYPGTPVDGTYDIEFNFTAGGELTLQCWEVEFTAMPIGP